MELFYSEQISPDKVILGEEESFHLVRVLRIIVGETVYVTNGKGIFITAQVETASPKECTLKVLEKKENYRKRNNYLHISIAPTKNISRFEWFLEKATEIGIDEITPLICHRSERKDVKTVRLNKVLLAAMKQSLKAYLPKLNSPISFVDFITLHHSSQKFICTCEASPNSFLKNLYKKGSETLLLIGPEGDFTPEEILMAEKYDFNQVSLGDSRLRTETAGIVSCSIVSLLNS